MGLGRSIMYYLATICLISTVAAKTSNYVTEIVADNGGAWGSWGNFQYCPAGAFVYGFSLKVEESQGGEDDTALNGIKLYCRYATTNNVAGFITSKVQTWGAWLGDSLCQKDYAVSMRLKVELPQHSGDDTAANNLEVKCTNGQHLSSSAGKWGNWGSWSQCPQGSAICGLQTLVEEPQGGGDDTALNSVKMACCSVQ